MEEMEEGLRVFCMVKKFVCVKENGRGEVY